MTVAQLNAADRAQFTASIGFVFENTPWIAQAVWERRPFADVNALFEAMLQVLDAAPAEARVALIAAHPDLAGRVAREGRVTRASLEEQASAGLDRLTTDEISRFDRLNGAYRDRFAFPFVICAREQTIQTILDALERRTHNDRATEIAIALTEIGKIARLRLLEAVKN
jgi:2-oxo-4-hydroxy-4-carboxy-5-ureidoimidazoline decarboxylase